MPLISQGKGAAVETQELIRQELKEPKDHVAAIGPGRRK